jgi:hypothetical protein
MGPLGQAPIGSRSPDRWVPLDALSSWPTDQTQGTWPVRLRVRPATKGTNPDHRSEEFLDTLKAGPAGGRLRRPSSAGTDPTATGEPASPSAQVDAVRISDRRVLCDAYSAGGCSALQGLPMRMTSSSLRIADNTCSTSLVQRLNTSEKSTRSRSSTRKPPESTSTQRPSHAPPCSRSKRPNLAILPFCSLGVGKPSLRHPGTLLLHLLLPEFCR